MAPRTHLSDSRNDSVLSALSYVSLARLMASIALYRRTSSAEQKLPQRCCSVSLMASTERCIPICWLMTALTRPRATSRPLGVVRRSAYVKLASDSWSSGAHDATMSPSL